MDKMRKSFPRTICLCFSLQLRVTLYTNNQKVERSEDRRIGTNKMMKKDFENITGQIL